MIFSSTLFLFIFLPIVFILYYIIPGKLLTARNILLMAASLLFYAWGEPRVILMMLLSIAVNYGFGLLLGKKRTRLAIAGAVVFNLSLLGYFKYANFFAENINALFGTGIVSDIALPIGISFFTFQIMSYVIDVYRGSVQPQRKLFNLALYIFFFPQLIAGPIVRYIDIEAQLDKRSHSFELIANGFRRFIIGLAKKVLIANQAALFADYAFGHRSPSIVAAWAGVVSYALQIYFDFSGYSDMAIGLGRMFGFEFLENFNYPYISRTVQEFWRRWHMSLSTWFKDYLYIPLGGNRKGAARTYVNLLIVFLATGFWHGASWSFVVWGVYHGVFLMLERGAFGRALKKLPRALCSIYTLLVVLFGWVVFRAEDLQAAGVYLVRLFDFTTLNGAAFKSALANTGSFTLAASVVGVVFCAPLLGWVKGKLHHGEGEVGAGLRTAVEWGSMVVCLCLLLLSIVFLTGSDFNPFLYFRF
jgi:alginate O-acetyltransferase complex protein AlgI